MRFEVSRVMDAIEQRLSTDPALARGVLDLAEVVRYVDLDGGRPASMLRLGAVIDALSRLLAEENVPVYVIVDRGLLADADLTSNERMVARRWADDGLVEVLAQPGDRLLEVADLTGLPVLSRYAFDGLRERYPWAVNEPGRVLAAKSGPGAPTLVPRVPGRGGGQPSPAGRALLARLWRCPERGCASFGGPREANSFFGDDGPPKRAGAQPPPRLRSGTPVCPRHDARLTDLGPRPPAETLAVRVDDVVRRRFVVAADDAVVIGRAPEEPGGVMLGHWLTDEARRWVSRSHVRLELRGPNLVARDTSTNGTVVRLGGSMAEADRIILTHDQARAVADNDLLELYPGVQIGRAQHVTSNGAVEPASVLAEAPTIALRVLR